MNQKMIYEVCSLSWTLGASFKSDGHRPSSYLLSEWDPIHQGVHWTWQCRLWFAEFSSTAQENGYAEHPLIPPKSSRAVKWNERSLQMTKYFDSLGNVKFHFDISEAFLWNWTFTWIIWKCGFFILILDANKHWNIWIIHAVKTAFGQLYSLTSLGTESILMIHKLPVVCQIFFFLTCTFSMVK